MRTNPEHQRPTLTAGAWQAARIQQEPAREIETECERRVGKERFRIFDAVLHGLSENQGHAATPR
jgi:hypothetical protein